MRIVTGFMLCVLLSGAVGAEPTVATWQRTEAGSFTWEFDNVWDTETIPTNETFEIHFDNPLVAGDQYIYFPTTESYTYIRLGSVYGLPCQTFSTAPRRFNGTTRRTLFVGNPNGFLGTWASADAYAKWLTETSATFTPVFHNFSTLNNPIFEAPSNRVEIGRLVGGGELNKIGEGTLAIQDVDLDARGRTRLHVSFGDLELGFASSFPTSAVPGAYVRFDASRADTLTLEPGADGRTHVTAWRDADGGPVTAVPFTGKVDGKDPGIPFLSETTCVHGIPLVDFGAYRSNDKESLNYETWAAQKGEACGLVFPPVETVREIFAVFEDTQPTDKRPFVTGHLNYWDTHRGSNNTLLDTGNAPKFKPENGGSAMLNGASIAPNGGADFSRLNVVSISAGADVRVGTLCIDRTYRIGGARIAELIIYTNALTAAERTDIHRYLRRKWTQWNLPEVDLDMMRLDRNLSVKVPEGKTVLVDTLDAPSAVTLTKTGAGRLAFHSSVRSGVSFDVQEGALAFPAPENAVNDAEPAAWPDLWIDASAADSLVVTNIEDGTGRTYISAWKDCRPDKTGKGTHEPTDVNCPFIVENAANGLPVIDFGEGWMKEWCDWGTAGCGDTSRLLLSANFNTFDGFIVLRTKKKNGYSTTDRSVLDPAFFGSTQQTFTRWSTGWTLANYADMQTLAALWEFDGVPQEPYGVEPLVGTNEFTVVSFSADSTALVNRIADDRLGCVGGVQIAEMLLYTRKLSPSERKSTQAYLMKKWKNATHPAQTPALEVRSLSFGAGAEPVLETGRPIVAAAIRLSNDGTLAVSGGGSLQLPPYFSGAKGLRADGATVRLPAGDPFSDAIYHFDASDPTTLECEVVEGGAKTNILKWRDVRGTGAVASAYTNSAVCVAPPTLQTVVTKNGKTMPVVDFGDLSKNNNFYKPTSAGMTISVPGWDGLVAEAHVVYCDAHIDDQFGCGDRFVFSDTDYYSTHRGEKASGQLFGAYTQNPWTQYIKDGYVAVDGTARAFSYNMNDRQFHIVSLAPSAPIYVRSIALDRRSQRAGGCYQGELIAFPSTLTADRRKYLQDYLAWKWFGEGTEPSLPVAFDSFEAVNGGVISAAGAVALRDGGSLRFDFNSPLTYGKVTIGGSFTFPATGTIEVEVASKDVLTGSYPLLEAASIVGTPLGGGWNIDVANDSKSAAFLRMEDGKLCLRFAAKGTVLIFK